MTDLDPRDARNMRRMVIAGITISGLATVALAALFIVKSI